MNRFKFVLLSVSALLMGVFSSCSDDDNDSSSNETVELTINASAADAEISDYSNFVVSVTSERTNKTVSKNLNADGTATVTVDLGSYTIEINGTENNVDFFGSVTKAQYSANTSLDVTVAKSSTLYKGKMKGLVISELFYNGGTYGGTMMHPDQYIVIANNSDEDICVNGLVICQAANMNSMPCNTLTDFLPDYVVAANMYQIPTGSNYVLAPGEVYVIAAQALNHSENYEYNEEKDTGIPADLSGADFELADEDATQYGKITDNPEVPNLVKICNGLPNGVTAWMHPYGIRPMFIFDGNNIDWDSWKTTNKVTYNEKANIKSEIAEYQGYKVSSDLIVDGVETTSETTPYWGGFDTKSLPECVDKSHIQATIEGCHHNTYMFRQKNGDKWVDTDNSANDMYIEHISNFAGYPKGWRNK